MPTVEVDVQVAGQTQRSQFSTQTSDSVWRSVGSSTLCDEFCQFLSPALNIAFAACGDFVAIRMHGQHFVGWQRIHFKVDKKRSIDLALLMQSETDSMRSILERYAINQSFLQSEEVRLAKQCVIQNLTANQLKDKSISEAIDLILPHLMQMQDSSRSSSVRYEFCLQSSARICIAVYCHLCLQGSLTVAFVDETITEILIDGDNKTWVERLGELQRAEPFFSNWEDTLNWLMFHAGQANQELFTERGFCDFALADGSRVHVALPPLARSSGYISLRRHRERSWALDELEAVGSLTKCEADLLRRSICAQHNILIVGSTSSGKTTLLQALAGEFQKNQRVVVLEDVAELRLPHPHCVYLQTRSVGDSALQTVTLEDLVREALRMRPDRLVVGECRGPEAFALLQALHTGHRGSLCTLHGKSIDDALCRFETMVLRAHPSLDVIAVRRMILSSIDLVVFLQRHSDGRRCLADIKVVDGSRNVESRQT